MSAEYLATVRAKRAHAWEAQKALLDTVANEGRDLSAEESEQIARMDADYDRYAAEEQRVAKRLDLVTAADAFRTETAPRVEAARQERRDPTDREMLAQMLAGERRGFETKPDPEFRALQSAGGSAIPVSFYDIVTVYLRYETPMFDGGVIKLLETPTGNNITLPRLTADQAFGGTVTAEAGAITEADPTLSSVTLESFGYKGITLWSAELGQDQVIGLDDLIGQSLARELTLDMAGVLTTGDGSSKPNGIVSAAGNGGTATGTAGNSTLDTFFGPADVIDLKYSVAQGYRARGTYMVSTTALQKMRKFRDNNRNFLFQPSLTAGVPDTFDGSRVVENPDMAAVASATRSVIFGDLSRYFVRRVVPVRIDISTDYKFASDQLAIRLVERIDGDLIDTAAVRFMVSANT